MSKGKRLRIYHPGLPKLFRPLLRKKLPSIAFLCQPRPAYGDEAVAGFAQEKTDKSLYALMSVGSSRGPKREHGISDPL